MVMAPSITFTPSIPPCGLSKLAPAGAAVAGGFIALRQIRLAVLMLVGVHGTTSHDRFIVAVAGTVG